MAVVNPFLNYGEHRASSYAARTKLLCLPRFKKATTMSQHALVNVIAAGDAAINAENFDAIVTFYADDATLVIEPGRCVTGHAAIRNAFIAIAEHFNHTLRVSQEEVLVLEGAGTALVLAKTRVCATLKNG